MFPRRQIRVTLVDADTGEQIVETSTPPTELPEHFEGYTTLQVGDATWEVTDAEPNLRREYLQSGELRLQVRRVESTTVPVAELLYSLPTIADFAPEINVDANKIDLNVLEIHEDDWRQIELISAQQEPAVLVSLKHISSILADQKTASGGYKKLHVRSEIAQGISDEVESSEVFAALGADSPTQSFLEFDGLSFLHLGGLVANAFALRSPQGLYIYGTANDTAITNLCLLRCRTSVRPDRDAAAITSLMKKHNLLFVDWCEHTVVPAADAAEYICSKVAYQLD